MLHCQFKI